MVTLLLVRHGFSEGNKTNTFTGHLDVPLCDVGIKQAELVSDYILKNYKVDAVYSSPLSRAINTVKKVADTLSIPLHVDEGIKEIYGGEWEGVSYKQIEEQDPVFYRKWSDNKGTVHCPNGESMEEAGLRALKSIRKICEENDEKIIVISSHGGVLRALRCFLSGLSIESFNDLPWMPNASISIVSYQDGKFEPIEFGFTDHLNGLSTNLPNL